MLEDGGLLQHFIEHSLGRMIQTSIVQLADEDSWDEASQFLLKVSSVSEKMLIWNRRVPNHSAAKEILPKMEG